MCNKNILQIILGTQNTVLSILKVWNYGCFAVGTNVHDQYICPLGMQTEAERLRTELRNTVAMYNQACENLVHAQAKVKP